MNSRGLLVDRPVPPVTSIDGGDTVHAGLRGGEQVAPREAVLPEQRQQTKRRVGAVMMPDTPVVLAEETQEPAQKLTLDKLLEGVDEPLTIVTRMDEALVIPMAVEPPDVVHEEDETVAPVLQRIEISHLDLSDEDRRAIGVQLYLLQQAGKMDEAHVRRACETVFDAHGTRLAVRESVTMGLLAELTLQTIVPIAKPVIESVEPVRVSAPTVLCVQQAISAEEQRRIEHEFLHGVSDTRADMHRKMREALPTETPKKKRQKPRREEGQTLEEITLPTPGTGAAQFIKALERHFPVTIRYTNRQEDCADDSKKEEQSLVEEAALEVVLEEVLAHGKLEEAAEGSLGSPLTVDGEQELVDDIDYEALGIDPSGLTTAKPGTEEKVLMLAARYAAGIPLWNDRDCYEHGRARLTRFISKIGGTHK